MRRTSCIVAARRLEPVRAPADGSTRVGAGGFTSGIACGSLARLAQSGAHSARCVDLEKQAGQRVPLEPRSSLHFRRARCPWARRPASASRLALERAGQNDKRGTRRKARRERARGLAQRRVGRRASRPSSRELLSACVSRSAALESPSTPPSTLAHPDMPPSRRRSPSSHELQAGQGRPRHPLDDSSPSTSTLRPDMSTPSARFDPAHLDGVVHQKRSQVEKAAASSSSSSTSAASFLTTGPLSRRKPAKRLDSATGTAPRPANAWILYRSARAHEFKAREGCPAVAQADICASTARSTSSPSARADSCPVHSQGHRAALAGRDARGAALLGARGAEGEGAAPRAVPWSVPSRSPSSPDLTS